MEAIIGSRLQRMKQGFPFRFMVRKNTFEVAEAHLLSSLHGLSPLILPLSTILWFSLFSQAILASLPTSLCNPVSSSSHMPFSQLSFLAFTSKPDPSFASHTKSSPRSFPAYPPISLPTLCSTNSLPFSGGLPGLCCPCWRSVKRHATCHPNQPLQYLS